MSSINQTGSRSSIPRLTQITFGSGAESKWQDEQRHFLRQRLRLFAPVCCLISLMLHIRIFVIFAMWNRLPQSYFIAMSSCGMFVLALTVALYANRNPTLTVLRRIELGLLFGVAMISFLWCHGWLVSGVVSSGPAPSGTQALLHNALWGITADNTTYFRIGPTIISFPTINNWSILSWGYALIIPNTWRRGAIMQGVLVLGALTSLGIATINNPGLRPFLAGNAASTIFIVGAIAVVSLYSSTKFEALRRTVFDAQQVGQYRLSKQLGRGAMGEVYLAQHRLLRRPCAIKLIRPEQAGSPEYLVRFEREVQAMALLTHPNTVEIYDYGHTDDGTFFYAMEYLPGLTLDAMVRNYGPLPPGRVIYLLRQICGALSEAHRQGIIHRDAIRCSIRRTYRRRNFDRDVMETLRELRRAADWPPR